MTEVVEKISPLTPVPFDGSLSSLTVGQRNLLALLSEHLKNGQPITRDDIAECYIKSIAPNGKRTWVYKDGRYQHVHVFFKKDMWSVRTKSIMWFKQNLGSCIIKGKILAIPVIDVKE